MTCRCPVLLSLVLATLTVPAASQDQNKLRAADLSVATLRKQLTSDDPATVAWAAYRAGKNDRKELVIDLRRVLRELRTETPKRNYSYELARSVMDAPGHDRCCQPPTR
ncbi:MAG: hypothetical protein ACI89X_001353 [Planctomycetota bacterium]|jgi:hypothetical protein